MCKRMFDGRSFGVLVLRTPYLLAPPFDYGVLVPRAGFSNERTRSLVWCCQQLSLVEKAPRIEKSFQVANYLRTYARTVA